MRRGFPSIGLFLVERRPFCPFARWIRNRRVNLAARSQVQCPESTTGYGHVWRLVRKDCNSFVNGPGHGGARQRGWPRTQIQAFDGRDVHLTRRSAARGAVFQDVERQRDPSVLDLRPESSARLASQSQRRHRSRRISCWFRFSPDSVLTLSFDIQGQEKPSPWIEGWRCIYDLKTRKFSIPPEFGDNNAEAVKTRDRSSQ
jgi:hypothetical protein